MFSDLAVLYLFAGGAGAGTLAVCCAIDLLLVRQPFGLRACNGNDLYVPETSSEALPRALDHAFAAGFALLALGAVSLVADLGRAERVLDLFLNPHPTVLTVGAYVLAVMIALGAFLAAVRLLYLPAVAQRLVRGAEAAAIPLALIAMAYTGVLMQSLAGVAFWRTPLVPAMFLLSSLSCGMAVLCLSGMFSDGSSERLDDLLRKLAYADALVIALETLLVALFLWRMGRSDHPGIVASISSLTQGDVAIAWWVGFCLFGMLVPLVLELTCARGRRCGSTSMKALALSAMLVLAGALCMRWSLVEAGEFRHLELETPQLEIDGGERIESENDAIEWK